jgi:regulator of sigma D
MGECLFRGKWKKEFKTQIYGCRYNNTSNILSFNEQCPYKDIDVEKCKRFKEKNDNEGGKIV